MKKLLLMLTMLTATVSMYGQNDELNKWVKKSNPIMQEKVKSSDSLKDVKKRYLGVGIGYTANKYMPITIHYTYENVYYGLNVSIPVPNGTKGEEYTTINWDELPEDHVSEGKYYVPLTFDLGFDIKDLTIGAGLGIAFQTEYRNCFDSYHILGNNGSYYKSVSGKSGAECKGFIKYRFPTENPDSFYRIYISAQYTIKTGIGATLGIEIF